MGNLNLREVKNQVQGHTAKRWQSNRLERSGTGGSLEDTVPFVHTVSLIKMRTRDAGHHEVRQSMALILAYPSGAQADTL